MPDPTPAPAHAKAIARYVHVSPQKARLVIDLIRGLKAEDALHLLRFTRKRIATDVAKLLQSAIANATDRGELDVDALVVTRAFVNEGPRRKGPRPAPMGRAYRVQHRSSHIEIHLGERPGAAALSRRVQAPGAPPAKRKPAGAATKRKSAPRPRPAPRGAASKSAKSAPTRAAKPKGGSKNKGGE